MRTMTIRNLPDEVYDGLKEMARANHRSLQEQVLRMLTEEVRLRTPSVCEEAAAYRAKLAGRTPARTVVEDLRADRER
ncbi:MAG: FitA-like ribbon-helix-helix domain-containing protein [Oceanipulchritudo sp.]